MPKQVLVLSLRRRVSCVSAFECLREMLLFKFFD